MAKKKKEVDSPDAIEVKVNENKDIIKLYGDVLLDASHIVNNPPPVISVSPKLDMALGGGVPEGSLFIMTGKEKIGKTVTALQFCKNAQEVRTAEDKKRKIFFANIEGRLKKRDLEGIRGLIFDDREQFEVIGSTKGNIISGEKYLSILDHIVHNRPHSVCVIDSFSALAAEKELTEDLDSVQVAAMSRFIAKFTRRFANVLPINRVTLVGITHLMANIGAIGKAKKTFEKSGTALKYAQDVKLSSIWVEPLRIGDPDTGIQIGQSINWTIENSAIGPPGQKVKSHIKYGHGIWNELELVELLKDFGLIKTAGSWLTMPNGEKLQGKFKVTDYLEKNPNAYHDWKKQVFEMVGI